MFLGVLAAKFGGDKAVKNHVSSASFGRAYLGADERKALRVKILSQAFGVRRGSGRVRFRVGTSVNRECGHQEA